MANLLNAARLSIIETARRLGVHPSSVWRWILTGARGRKLPTILVGARRYVLVAELEAFLASGLTSAPPTATHPHAPAEERASATTRKWYFTEPGVGVFRLGLDCGAGRRDDARGGGEGLRE